MATGDIRRLIDMIKDQDGEGSGLDADLLRGLPADFTCSKNSNGYQKLPSGLIIQWGRGTISSPASGSYNIVTVTFPITFPNGILRGYVCLDGYGANTKWMCIFCQNFQTNSMDVGLVVSANEVDRYFDWIAIGY